MVMVGLRCAVFRKRMPNFDKKLGVFQKPAKLVMSLDKERRTQRSLTTIEYRYQIDFGILSLSVPQILKKCGVTIQVISL